MKTSILCLVLAVTVQATVGLNNKLYGTFSAPGVDPERKASFFEIPRLQRDAKEWKEDSKYGPTVNVNGQRTQALKVFCRNGDYHVCALFDQFGSVAGLQVSFAVADFQKSGAPVGNNLVRQVVAGTEVYSKIFLFIDKETQKKGGRTLGPQTLTAPTGVTFDDDTHGTHRMELTEDANKGNLFTKQNCMPSMGRHYFFNITNEHVSDDCSGVDKTFSLYSEQTHELVGGGVIFFGKSTPVPNGRPWMEYPPGFISTYIAPNAPKCVHSNAKEFGLTSFHFYLVDEPWTIKC